MFYCMFYFTCDRSLTATNSSIIRTGKHSWSANLSQTAILNFAGCQNYLCQITKFGESQLLRLKFSSQQFSTNEKQKVSMSSTNQTIVVIRWHNGSTTTAAAIPVNCYYEVINLVVIYKAGVSMQLRGVNAQSMTNWSSLQPSYRKRTINDLRSH